ncbi:chaperone protein DnaJ 20, chloroplastic-like protein [Tanacetum coccineum]
MALKYHPDVCPPDCAYECNMRFIQVKEAYETLSNPESRAMYDTCIAKGLPLGQTSLSEKGQWKATWETQVAELKQRSAMDDGRTSWAERVRKQRR